MNTYMVVKTLHIISATLMVGTGFGTAFYLFWANRSGSVAAQAVVSKWDGAWLWVKWTLALYALAGVCWLPVVWLQIKMARQAAAAWQAGENTLPASYKRYQFWWEMLGYPAFCATVVMYFLMVLKPM